MVDALKKAVKTMTHRIAEILENNEPSIYLYGSTVLDDFKPGWSDIDILVLTQKPITQEQAERLLFLRQTLLREERSNPYYRSFEGGILSLEGFLTKAPDTVVYWGTSGERITDRYRLDSFGLMQLLDSGILLRGREIRDSLNIPTYDDLKADVRRHYQSIRQHAQKTGRDLYSYGWLLDISRCLYTLRTGRIIAKTAAGEWALRENLCPCAGVLARAVEIRKDPLRFLIDERTFDDAEKLGDSVQMYADSLACFLQEEQELDYGNQI